MKNYVFILLCVCAGLIICSCSDFSAASSGSTGADLDSVAESRQKHQKQAASNAFSAKLKIVAWNAETFFDAQTDGLEYSEFKKSSAGWGREAYIQRLDRLCEVIKALDADIVALEEIENAGIIYDISNRLAGNAWQKNKIYDYACFAREKGSSIGCAVLSRHLISGVKVHSLKIKTEKDKQPAMRPVMEVEIFAGGRTLSLFVNHWKSMSGGEDETEIWRKWEESVLAHCFAKLDENASGLACGDFNRNIEKFSICSGLSEYVPLNSKISGDVVVNQNSAGNKVNVLLNYVFPKSENDCTPDSGAVGVYSPWILENGSVIPTGSYYYNESWNYLDHFFSYGCAKIISFNTEKNGSWADENGIPQGYKIYTGGGYSDHLPVSCIVCF